MNNVEKGRYIITLIIRKALRTDELSKEVQDKIYMKAREQIENDYNSQH